MKVYDLIEFCVKNLLRRRTRTLLAIIGVVVGTCAIIVMLSIGFGLTQSYQEQIGSYGNLHIITVNSNSNGSVGSAAKEQKGVINDAVIEKMSRIEGVDATTPVINEYLTMGIGKKVATVDVMGIDADVLEKFNYSLSKGRMLKKSDKMGILFGNQIPHFFLDPSKPNYNSWENPAEVVVDKIVLTGDSEYGQKKRQKPDGEGQEIIYPEYKVHGVGLLDNPNDESAYSAYMNIADLEKIKSELQKAKKERALPQAKKTYQQALVYMDDINMAEEVSKTLREEFGVQTSSPTDWLNEVKNTMQMIQFILGGIGGVSLFVAALGITNTMIMSIYERTREIGVMKVIGANLKDIKRMFILEAGLIGFGGGVLGVIISYIISFMMNTVLKDIIGMALGSLGGGMGGAISVIPLWLIPASLAFSTGIGIIAGYYPAKRAMRLSALESLKNE